MPQRGRQAGAIAVMAVVMLWAVMVVGRASPHPSSGVSVEPMLRRASGACLARIVRLEEQNEIPQDGDHWVKAWLDVSASSGTIPEYLYLVVEHGGFRAPDINGRPEQPPAVLRHDSLQAGERHWFVFSEDYDSDKYPPKVAGWWPHRDGTVPRQVVAAIENDRFAGHPFWDKTLNVVCEARPEKRANKFHIRVREADSLDRSAVLFEKTMVGTMEYLQLQHGAWSYEMEWPADEELHVVSVGSIADLPQENSFQLPAGTYRFQHAFELKTGRKLAVWIAKNQEVWLMQAFRQYDRETGETLIEMQFDLPSSGGRKAGGETENWYRRIVRRYESGRLRSERVFRHQVITTGNERIYSGSGWIPVDR